jgi:hypothetical protein
MGSHSDSRAEMAKAQSSRMRCSWAGKHTLKKCHTPGSLPYTDPPVELRVFSLSRLSSARSSSTSFISRAGLSSTEAFSASSCQRFRGTVSYMKEHLLLRNVCGKAHGGNSTAKQWTVLANVMVLPSRVCKSLQKTAPGNLVRKISLIGEQPLQPTRVR